MLPKPNRLTKREDFATIFSKGAYASIYEGITVKFIKNETGTVRLGFPVGKNFSKKAVDRNRARRVLRAASFQFLSALKPENDIVVLLKPGYKITETKKVAGDLKKVFVKANLLT